MCGLSVRFTSLPASPILATEISGLRTGAIWNVMFRGCPSRVFPYRTFCPMFGIASPVAERYRLPAFEPGDSVIRTRGRRLGGSTCSTAPLSMIADTLV